MPPFYAIFSYRSLLQNYLKLKAEDLVLTRIPIKEANYSLIFDLQVKGVLSFPSFLSQILSSSKVAQVIVLKNFMPPYTYVITSQISLLEIMQNPPPYDQYVTKKDKANCGLGIYLWNSLEDIFKFAGTSVLEFPFVLQPFYKDWKDIRVILLGERYQEAYIRENKGNFRQNLFFGGKAYSYILNAEELNFCKAIMDRGTFPYAHIDLAYVEGRGPFLSEINLKGGIKGAKISIELYEEIIKSMEKEYFNLWQRDHQPFEIL